MLGAGIAKTIEPLTILSANNLNDESLKISVTSDKINGFLKSGLSLPYFLRDSSNVICSKGGLEIEKSFVKN